MAKKQNGIFSDIVANKLFYVVLGIIVIAVLYFFGFLPLTYLYVMFAGIIIIYLFFYVKEKTHKIVEYVPLRLNEDIVKTTEELLKFPFNKRIKILHSEPEPPLGTTSSQPFNMHYFGYEYNAETKQYDIPFRACRSIVTGELVRVDGGYFRETTLLARSGAKKYKESITWQPIFQPKPMKIIPSMPKKEEEEEEKEEEEGNE